REPARAAARGAEPDRSQAALRLDRPHLSAAQAPRLLALLRLRRKRAGLRVGRNDLPELPTAREDAGDLEPAAVVHDRPPRPSGAGRRAHLALLLGGAARAAAGGLVADAEQPRQRASAEPCLER